MLEYFLRAAAIRATAMLVAAMLSRGLPGVNEGQPGSRVLLKDAMRVIAAPYANLQKGTFDGNSECALSCTCPRIVFRHWFLRERTYAIGRLKVGMGPV